MRDGSLQHREQVTKNSNYVLQWSTTDEIGAGVAVKLQDTVIHTVQASQKNGRATLYTQSGPQRRRHI